MVLVNNLESTTVLDLELLGQYTQAIGGKALLGSVDVFLVQYPLYLAELVAFQLAGDSQAIKDQGHKMKGAAGAIGLVRLGLWAQYIQHDDGCDWQDNVPKYIAKIEQYYQHDIAVLRDHLENA